VKGLVVDFVSQKENDYKTMLHYFKVVDPSIEQKMRKLFKESETNTMPYWKTDRGDYILKVKSKHVEKKELNQGETYSMDIVFEPFVIVESDKQGYYAKVSNIQKYSE
jgi:hypothetical protein